ncbi:hypothetical protein GCM10027271_15190 [Saccharopolyspora gloriosae]|uniref:NAD(+)--protein-arginine ADP-ribosyltransferase n=1 Tax=Saccharopolyspora gloriosae TaxID=455344 RepID=A0A840N8D2_9PSEU|nr:hypothetical protein [Saccharopolyspora gloriosae]MBB5067071.1 hypothetical protein [Saccharopolyspora gloriosae]
MTNPLSNAQNAADPAEPPESIKGIGIAESWHDVTSLNDGSSWIESGLAYGGLAMEAVSVVVDPIGTLLSYGLSWLIEHVQPLQDALDWFAGDPQGVEAYAQQWQQVAVSINTAATGYSEAVRADTAQWTGAAGDAYRRHAAEKGEALTGAGKLAETIGTVVEAMGMVVSFVRDFVRDLIADCISRLITYALEACAPPVVSLAWVVPQAVAFIAKTVTKVSDVVQKLLKTISNVSPKMAKMVEAFGDIMRLLGKGGKQAGEKAAQAGRFAAKAADKLDVSGKIADKAAEKAWRRVDDVFGTDVAGKHQAKFGPDLPGGSGGGAGDSGGDLSAPGGSAPGAPPRSTDSDFSPVSGGEAGSSSRAASGGADVSGSARADEGAAAHPGSPSAGAPAQGGHGPAGGGAHGPAAGGGAPESSPRADAPAPGGHSGQPSAVGGSAAGDPAGGSRAGDPTSGGGHAAGGSPGSSAEAPSRPASTTASGVEAPARPQPSGPEAPAAPNTPRQDPQAAPGGGGPAAAGGPGGAAPPAGGARPGSGGWTGTPGSPGAARQAGGNSGPRGPEAPGRPGAAHQSTPRGPDFPRGPGGAPHGGSRPDAPPRMRQDGPPPQPRPDALPPGSGPRAAGPQHPFRAGEAPVRGPHPAAAAPRGPRSDGAPAPGGRPDMPRVAHADSGARAPTPRGVGSPQVPHGGPAPRPNGADGPQWGSVRPEHYGGVRGAATPAWGPGRPRLEAQSAPLEPTRAPQRPQPAAPEQPKHSTSESMAAEEPIPHEKRFDHRWNVDGSRFRRLDISEDLHAKLGTDVQHIRATTAGISMVRHSGPVFNKAEFQQKLPRPAVDPKRFTVEVHGGPHGVRLGGTDLNAKELAEVIKAAPGYKPGEPVRLLACRTGADTGDGTPNFAQELAKELGVEVVAPKTDAWVDNFGNIYASNDRASFTPDASGAPQPRFDEPGQWTAFRPDGTTAVHDSPYPPGHEPEWVRFGDQAEAAERRSIWPFRRKKDDELDPHEQWARRHQPPPPAAQKSPQPHQWPGQAPPHLNRQFPPQQFRAQPAQPRPGEYPTQFGQGHGTPPSAPRSPGQGFQNGPPHAPGGDGRHGGHEQGPSALPSRPPSHPQHRAMQPPPQAPPAPRSHPSSRPAPHAAGPGGQAAPRPPQSAPQQWSPLAPHALPRAQGPYQPAPRPPMASSAPSHAPQTGQGGAFPEHGRPHTSGGDRPPRPNVTSGPQGTPPAPHRSAFPQAGSANGAHLSGGGPQHRSFDSTPRPGSSPEAATTADFPPPRHDAGDGEPDGSSQLGGATSEESHFSGSEATAEQESAPYIGFELDKSEPSIDPAPDVPEPPSGNSKIADALGVTPDTDEELAARALAREERAREIAEAEFATPTGSGTAGFIARDQDIDRFGDILERYGDGRPYRRLDSEELVMARLKNPVALRGVTDVELTAMRSYTMDGANSPTGGSCYQLNERLRNGDPPVEEGHPDYEKLPGQEEYRRVLTSGLNKMRANLIESGEVSAAPVSLGRNIGVPLTSLDDFAKRYAPGNAVTENAFVSCSPERSDFQPKGYHPETHAFVQFTIKTPDGVSVQHLSGFEFERETLVVAGRNFRVTHFADDDSGPERRIEVVLEAIEE